MSNVLTRREVAREIESAAVLARRVKAPRGVHGIRVESDENQDGNPILVIFVEEDDDPDPSDERLDELIDYEEKVASEILDGGLASWPLVRIMPRASTAR